MAHLYLVDGLLVFLLPGLKQRLCVLNDLFNGLLLRLQMFGDRRNRIAYIICITGLATV